MEKRNIIEAGRTPQMEKQGTVDTFEKDAIAAFKPIDARRKARENRNKREK